MGWYLAAAYVNPQLVGSTQTNQVVEVVPHVRIPPSEMRKIAQVLDKFAGGKPLNWMEGHAFTRSDKSLPEVVDAANEQAARYAKEQVDRAEELVQNLDHLRARAKEWESE